MASGPPCRELNRVLATFAPLDNPGELLSCGRRLDIVCEDGFILREIYCVRQTGTRSRERLLYLHLSRIPELDVESHVAKFSRMWFARDASGEYRFPVESDTECVATWTTSTIKNVQNIEACWERLSLTGPPIETIGIAGRFDPSRRRRRPIRVLTPP